MTVEASGRMHDDGTSSCGTADTGKESDDVSGAQTSEPADRGIRQTDSANSDAGARATPRKEAPEGQETGRTELASAEARAAHGCC
ncbi:hypothetical protein [Actinobaculum sp. 313]|uniref:hypothetical protein n=1 Tax=Actinobaculum sp. 313 TaxID=2495645 RepID=UPI000D52983D|nr:hypothetical protein [Actinobaculum sp. 313]AWE43174.1 hypothetical protein DDD63_10950 [Actinobaculum sp. 313]